MIEVGMDQHKHFSLAAALNVQTGEMTWCRLRHDDPERIAQYVRSLGEEVRVSLETTGNWYWLVDLLQAQGADVQLCNTMQTRRLHRARAKTDRLDAQGLAQLSAQQLLPTVYVPDRETRDGRERHRYRITLVRLRSKIKNVIHAILSKLNIDAPFSDLFGKAGLTFLHGLQLREPYGGELASALRMYQALSDEIQSLHREIRACLKADPLAELLMTIPGIGELTAYLLLHEIGPVERFPTQKHFVSYACLAPRTRQSAQTRRDLPVGRAGNLYLKGALTESAQTAVRHDPTLGAFYRKHRSRKGTSKAMVAAARKLAVAVYYVLKRQEPYRPAPTVNRRPGKPVLCLGQPG